MNSFWTVKANPYANESVLIAQSTSSQLTTRYWNGTSWQTPSGTAWWATNGAATIKQFDFTYFENDPTYKRGIALYRSSTLAPKYRIWYSTSASWGAETTSGLTSGTYRWLRLETVPNTNKVVCVGLTSAAGLRLRANVYDLDTGNWDTQKILADASITDATTMPRVFDLAIGTSTAMVVWVDTNNTTSLSYSTWTAAGGWATASMSVGYNIALSTNSQWVRLAAKPGSDEIQLVSNRSSTGGADTNIYAVIWDGSSWGNGTFISGNTSFSTEQRFDVNYERASGDCLIAFSSSTNTPPAYVTRPSGVTSWSTVSQANDFSSQGRWYRLVREESATSDDVYLMANCADNSVKWQKWTGGAWNAVFPSESNSLSSRQSFDMSISRVDVTLPSAISNLTASNTGLSDGQIKLEWTAPGDDGASGTVTGYLVKYSSVDVITTAGFAAAATYYQTWPGLLSGGNAESRILTGFTPGTTYWFAIKGYDEAGHYGVWKSSNDDGAYNMAASTWAQDVAPQVPVNLVAVSAGATQINLSWNANTDIDLYRYEFTASSWSETQGFSPATTTASISYSDTGLVTNNTYYYKIRAIDNTNHYSAYSSVVSTYPAQVPPAQPTGFDGLVLSTTAIRWSWTDNATNETGYRVKSDTDGVMGTLGQVPGGTTYYTESALAPNTSYYRYAEAFNGTGTSSSSAKILYTQPSTPGNLQAVSVTTWTVNLSWNAGAGGAYRYGLAKSTDNFNTNISSFVVFSNALTANTTTVYNLVMGTTYYFRVWAYNQDGMESAWDGPASTRTTALITYMDIVINEVMYDPQDGDTHEWVEIYNRSGADINLTGWKLFDGDGSKHTLTFIQGGTTIPAGGYAVLVDSATTFLNDYYNDTSSGTWIVIDTIVKLTNTNDTVMLYYSDSATVVSSVTYSNTWNNNATGKSIEKISAAGTENDAGSWQASSAAKGTPGARNSATPDASPPADTSNLTAVTGSTVEGTIRLAWTAPGNDGATGVLGSGSQYMLWASTNPINFTVSTAGGGTGATNPLSWQASISTSSVSPNASQSYTATGLFPGTTYYFAIRTKDPSANWSIWPGTAPGVNAQSYAVAYDTNPAKPAGLVLAPGYKKIVIDWNDDTTLDVSGYRVYYGSTTAGVYDNAGSPQTTVASSHTLTNLTNLTTYYIAVKTFDTDGLESVFSDAQQAYPALTASSWTVYQAVSGYTNRIYWEWAYLPDAVNGYRVYSSTNGLIKALEQSTTYWTETDIPANTQRSRYIRGVDTDVVEGYQSATVSRYTFAGKPGNLSSAEQTDNSITVTWTPPSGGAPGQYTVERDGQNTATVPGTTYVDTSLTSSTEYTYRVKSLNGDGLTDVASISGYIKDRTIFGTTPKPERKFITPGKDVKFGTDVEEVKVFDAQGREIIRKKKGSASFISWDGRSGGKSIESGAYIYQTKTRYGKRKYGTIILVK